MYSCTNINCPNYGGFGTVLKSSDVYSDNQLQTIRCRRCNQPVAKLQPQRDQQAKGVAGAAGGALLGWALGGPPGALIGGLIGLILGANAKEQNR